MKKILLILVTLTLLSTWPFFRNGFFKTHDGEWMIIRFTAFHQTLSGGQVPVRFVDRLANNYGYPVTNFLYPLPFYITEFFKVMGFGFVNSIKMTFILSTILSVLAMYWALKQFFSREGSLAGSIIYIFIPYRFVDLYIRGSIGENLAFVFLPLILGSIYKIKNNKKIFLPILSISTAGLILSHNVIAFIFLPIFLIMTLLIIGKKIETFFYYLLGVLIAAFFWIPAVYDLRFVKFSESNISSVGDHLVALSKLIIPSWGYGSTPNGDNGLSVQIGLVSLIVITVVVFNKIKQKNINNTINFLIILFFASLFMITNYSKLIWTSTSLEKFIQFPWRLLSVVVFSTAFLTAYVVDLNKKKLLVSILIIAGSILTTLVYTKPSAFINYPDGYYSTNEDSTTVKDEYLPIWVKVKPQTRASEKIAILNGDTKISDLKIKSSIYSFTTFSANDSKLRINSFYFPGWQIDIDGFRQYPDYTNDFGLMDFNLSKGNHNVLVKYSRTAIHLYSELISAIAGLISVILFIKFSGKKFNLRKYK